EALPEANWEGLAEVAAYFNGERAAHDALTVLQHLGRTLSVQELPTAVAACRSAGLADAADAMLNSAGQRDIKSVLHLASTLNLDRRHMDADVLLRAAMRTSA
ncbi:hypothetical protein ACWD4A_34375, partial [Streptomyces sp. NPDC002537]